jgi:RNA polymerase-binding transcription factor DksA
MLYLKIADCEMCGKHLPLKRLKARVRLLACNMCRVHYYRLQREEKEFKIRPSTSIYKLL